MSDFLQDFERLRNGEQAAALIVSRSRTVPRCASWVGSGLALGKVLGILHPLISSHTFDQAPGFFYAECLANTHPSLSR